MAAKTSTTKAPTKRARPTTEQAKPEQDSPTPEAEESGSAGVPLPTDPSAVRLQEEQDELQQPGRVSKHVADQIDNDPGYSKDQLAHMEEYWAPDE